MKRSLQQHPSRSSQSLLAPLSPIGSAVEQPEQPGDLLEERAETEDSGISGQEDSQNESKANLRALLDEVEGDPDFQQEQQDELRPQGHFDTAMHEVEVEFERQQVVIVTYLELLFKFSVYTSLAVLCIDHRSMNLVLNSF